MPGCGLQGGSLYKVGLGAECSAFMTGAIYPALPMCKMPCEINPSLTHLISLNPCHPCPLSFPHLLIHPLGLWTASLNLVPVVCSCPPPQCHPYQWPSAPTCSCTSLLSALLLPSWPLQSIPNQQPGSLGTIYIGSCSSPAFEPPGAAVVFKIKPKCYSRHCFIYPVPPSSPS